MQLTSLGIGTVLGDRYLITRAIKSGGMGVVYAAQDQRLADTPCAIKQLLDTDMEGDSAALVRRKFTEEMRFLATLNHPGVPRIRDFFILDDKSFLVMDLVEGDTLEQELEAAIAEGHALPVMGVVDDMIDVLDVLDYLHHHDPPVVHRDVKPANLIRERASGKIKLVDFGIARMHMEARTTTHTQLGTLSYAPLEQIQGHAEPRSDVYALAATMHHLISGQLSPPLAIPPLQRVVPGVNPDLAAIVNRGFQAAAIDRFGSAAEMRQELMAWRAAHGGKALPPSPIAPPREPGVTEKTSLRASDGGPTIDASPRGAPWMAAFVTAMLVLIAGVVAMGMWNRPQEPPAGKRDTPSAVAALEQPRPSQTLTPQPPVSTPLPGTPEKKTPVAPAPSTAARETPKPV
ncbi:MAG: hypothetical protein FJX76_08475, partial [Armatimonadetes bacterium]|nr:hypothetical protein [Armatimonadota bacterium]